MFLRMESAGKKRDLKCKNMVMKRKIYVASSWRNEHYPELEEEIQMPMAAEEDGTTRDSRKGVFSVFRWKCLEMWIIIVTFAVNKYCYYYEVTD